MDKTTRQILYKPPTQIETGKKDEGIARIDTTKKIASPVLEVSKNSIPDGKKLADWLKGADLINRTALCRACKIDRGNFDKYLQKGTIPDQYTLVLINTLKQYGYAE